MERIKKMENKIFQLTQTGKLEAVIGETEKMAENSVMVKLEYIGICGSDLGFYESGMVGPDPVPFPIVLGHECAGTVVQVGPKVTKVRVGDKVCLEPGVPCGHCEFCRSGNYNLCPDVDFMAAPPFKHGALMEYVVHPEEFTYKLPDNIDTLDGVMMEPFSVGYHAAEQGDVCFGKKIVILGAGCIGLMTIMACRLMGAVDIIAVDLYDSRLEMAKRAGASVVINPKEQNLTAEIMKLFPAGADLVYETAGSEITTKQSGALVKPGGTICIVGMTHTPVPFDFFEIQLKEAAIKTVFRYRNSYEKVIDAVAKGLVKPKEIITNIFSFEGSDEAFKTSLADKQNIVKAVIKIN